MKNFWIPLIVATGLTGCSHYTQLKDVYIDNTSVNNFIGNPCGFYVGDHCVYLKPSAKNPDNPYTK